MSIDTVIYERVLRGLVGAITVGPVAMAWKQDRSRITGQSAQLICHVAFLLRQILARPHLGDQIAAAE